MIEITELVRFLNKNGIIRTTKGNYEGVSAVTFSALNNPSKDSICWTGKILPIERIPQCQALICLPEQPTPEESKTIFLFVDSPRKAFAKAIAHFLPEPQMIGISDKSEIHKTVNIGKEVYIGDGCVIGEDCSIGDKTTIDANVTIYNGVKIGANCRILSGAVIGNDGFGYFWDDDNLYKKIRHIGGVLIGDNVDIGANTCINRGVLEDTFIGDNTKIGDLVLIGHNVKIGKSCIITATLTICGSVSIGDDCWLSPGSIIDNEVILPDETRLGVNSVAHRSVKVKNTNRCLFGNPAKVVFTYYPGK